MKINKETSQKISEVSLFAAFLIVALHVHAEFARGSAASFFYVGIRTLASIAVPYFCLISGFFLAAHMGEPGWWGDAVRKRVKSLLVPFFFWNVMAWLFYAVLHYVAALKGVSFGDGFVNGITLPKVASYLGFNMFDYPMHGHYWYVRMLFMFVLIAPLFTICRRRKVGAVIIALLLALLVGFNRVLGQGPERWLFFWEWTFPIRCLVFIAIGIWLSANRLTLPRWIGRVALIVGCALLTLKGLGINLGPELSLLTTLLLMLGVWENWYVWHWPTIILSCAFPVFTLHWFVTRGTQIVLKVAGQYDNTRSSFPVYIVSLIAAWVVSFFIAYLMRRCMPRLSAVVFGR